MDRKMIHAVMDQTGAKGPLFAQRSLKEIKAIGTGKSFSMVTYNTLADSALLISPAYGYCKEKFKERNVLGSHRHELLIKELLWLDADILCLQEVDSSYFQELLYPELSKLGYEGLFAMNHSNGVASFFRKNVFELIMNKSVSVKDEMQKVCKQIEQDSLADYLQTSTTVLLMALKYKTSSQILLIGNVHVSFAWYGHVVSQLLECCLVTKIMHDFAGCLQSAYPSLSAPYVLCGDFNIEPHFPAYNVLVTGGLSEDDFRRSESTDFIKYYGEQISVRPPPVDKKISLDELKVLKCLKKHLVSHLKSAKSTYNTVLGREPSFTNHEGGIDHWTLDYLWFSPDSLQPVAVLDVVAKSIVDELGGLPNEHFCSDHLSLKAVYRFQE